MTEFHYWRCDECGKVLANCECHPNQLMYTLLANYDTSVDTGEENEIGSNKAHFCSQKCLKRYVDTKVKDHADLPITKDEEMT